MRLQGQKRDHHGDYATNLGGWTGRQSRKVARRRRADKKLLHRLGRRRARQIVRES